MKLIMSSNPLKSAITTQLSTVGYGDVHPFPIRVGSSEPPSNPPSYPINQTILTINMLPPTIQNFITQDDLDWLIFNLGNMIKVGGAFLTGITKMDLQHLGAQGIGNWLRGFAFEVADTLIRFTGGVTGNFINFFSTTGATMLANFRDYLKPVTEGGQGGGDTIANTIATLIQSTTSYIRNGITDIVNGIFKSSGSVLGDTFPLTVNIFVVNILQQLPQLIQDGMNTVEKLAVNAVNQVTRSVFEWGKHLGSWSGEEVNIALPRILNVEKQDILCQWLEWWLFDSDFGKWENQINPIARMSKEATYKSICYSTTIGIGDTDIPILPIGFDLLPHQIKSFINGTWTLSWSSRPKPIQDTNPMCKLQDGVLTCRKGGYPL